VQVAITGDPSGEERLTCFVHKNIMFPEAVSASSVASRTEKRDGNSGKDCMSWAVPGCIIGALLVLGCARTGTSGIDTSNASAAEGETFVVSPNAAKVAGAYNVRRVPALRTRDGRHVRSGVLLRSGHLGNVREEGHADLVKLGIASIIDLRSRPEVEAAPDAPWISSGTRHLVVDLPKPDPSAQQSCIPALNAAEPKLAAIFAHLGAPGSLPAVVHCGLGRDRACLCMAIILLSLGVPAEEVAADFHTNQAAAVEAHWLDDLFARVAARGGIDEYLAAHAVARNDVESLRSQALE
jgi:hypothetical protein